MRKFRLNSKRQINRRCPFVSVFFISTQKPLTMNFYDIVGLFTIVLWHWYRCWEGFWKHQNNSGVISPSCWVPLQVKHLIAEDSQVVDNLRTLHHTFHIITRCALSEQAVLWHYEKKHFTSNMLLKKLTDWCRFRWGPPTIMGTL